MEIVNRVWALIETKDISAYKLAKEVGLPTSQLSQWRSGKTKPSLDALIKVADYFNVSLDYLVGRSDNPKGGIE